MKKYRAPSLVLAVVVCAASLVVTVLAADNFTGTWKLNLQMSQYSPGPPPRSLTSRLEIMGDTINLTFDGYEANGKAIEPAEITIKLDGKDYPIEGDPTRDTISMKKIDDYTIEETNKKAGKVTTIVRTVYAKDGKSRTQTTTGTTPDGQKVNNVAFFDRLR